MELKGGLRVVPAAPPPRASPKREGEKDGSPSLPATTPTPSDLRDSPLPVRPPMADVPPPATEGGFSPTPPALPPPSSAVGPSTASLLPVAGDASPPLPPPPTTDGQVDVAMQDSSTDREEVRLSLWLILVWAG